RRDAILVFAGSGPLEADLRTAARAAGVEDRVRFAGQLDVASLADAFAAADLVVSASRSETQGLALCEAAAAGRVVVAPDRGGYAEVLEHGAGGAFPSRDPSPAELASCVDGLVADSEVRGRLAAAAARRDDAAWSARAVAASLRGAYAAAASVRE